MAEQTYNNISRPYNSAMERSEFLNVGGDLMTENYSNDGEGNNTVLGNDISDLWIGNWIKSRNYKPKTSGFMLDGKTGNAEFANITLSGGLLSYGKTGFTDSTNAGYVLSSDGVYIGAASDATMFKYTISSGVLEFVGAHSSGTVGGQNVTDVANVSNPTADAVPTNLAVDSSGITIGEDGSQTAYIVLTWDAVSTNTFDHYQVRYRKGTSTYYTYLDSKTNTLTIEGLVPNIEYNFGIASVNKHGVSSSFSTNINGTTPTDTDAPATVSGVTATGGIQYTIVEWTDNTESDLDSYNIYRNTEDNSGTATLVGNCYTTYFVDGGRTGGTTYYYWIKAVDTSGNLSASFSTVATATPRDVETTDVELIAANKILIDGAIYLSNWQKTGDLTKIDGGNISTSTIVADSLDVDQLSAISADMGAITAGTITLDNAGHIKGGQTDYATGTGFFLGYSGNYKFSIGSTTNYLRWDGAYLTLKGSFDVGNDGTINNSVYTVANLPIAPTSDGFNSPSAYE